MQLEPGFDSRSMELPLRAGKINWNAGGIISGCFLLKRGSIKRRKLNPRPSSTHTALSVWFAEFWGPPLVRVALPRASSRSAWSGNVRA